jgi:ABC-type nitrate/sulfonate/bicarbonate transport system substrate-binding protein
VSRRPISKHAIHIGFVPLIDAAPLIAASELGYFADEGLDVRLERQIGWGNVRDKLTYGQLHASHALIGMPAASVAGMEYYHEPLVGLMSLGAGGNAITIDPRLAQHTDGGKSAQLWRRHLGRPLNIAHVFSSSVHHYFVRDYFAQAGLILDRDAHLCVLPPPQLVTQIKHESIDGFCVGEPWNTLAMMEGRGTIVAATTELLADHPDKVLAVNRRWYDQNRPVAESIVRATVRGCDFCEDPDHRGRLTEILAGAPYLNLAEDVIAKSLSIDEWLKPGVRRPRFRSFARAATVPSVHHVEWLVKKMMQWGHLPADTNARRIAAASIVTETYTEAVAALANTPVLQGAVL